MANLQPVHLQDEDGTTYTIFVETTAPIVPLSPGDTDGGDRESYGITEDTVAKFKDIHGTNLP
jgi:hypothetical protein